MNSPSGQTKSPPPAIPDHHLLRRIGRGSYGEVWLARNIMGMYRAVKIVHRKSFEHERPFERELSGIRKFEPISRSYEGFIDVLHAGINEEQGYFYYVMELGDDQNSGQNINPESYSPKTLAKEISLHGRLPLPECVELGLALSRALAELHKHGLVHRDIKPSNIIFVNGTPKLADIGLVADANEACSYVGTEGFIPPEGPGRPQADVYSLGKALYEASTGKDRQDFPELPTLLDKFADPEGFLELNEVILQACKNEASKRYPSAWEMHADLLVLANGKSVKRLKILERRLARLKRIAGTSTLVLVVMAFLGYQAYREWSNARAFRQRQVDANVASGNRATESGDLLRALPYFAEALRLDEHNADKDSHRLRFGSTLAQCPKLTHLWFSGIDARDAEFSPDGQKVVISQFFKGKAQIRDLSSNEAYGPAFGQEGLVSAEFSPDGRFVVTASQIDSACVWNMTNFARVLRLPHPDKVLNARFSPDGLRIVTAGIDGFARVWDARTGELKITFTRHSDAVVFAIFSHDGRFIATASQDGTARIWDATDGHAIWEPFKHTSWVKYAAFSPDDKKLVTACFDRKARVWDVETGNKLSPDMNHRDGVESAEFSPDGRLIVTASLDGNVYLWSADNLQPLGPHAILRHGERVTHASFSPDGRRIVTTCTDVFVRIWDLAGCETTPVLMRNVFSEDASRFIAVSPEGIQVKDTLSGNAVSPFINPASPMQEMKLDRDGKFLLTCSGRAKETNELSRLFEIREVATGRLVGPPLILSNVLANISISEDGGRLLAFTGGIAQTWDVPSGKPLSPPLQHGETIQSAFFAPDGARLATRGGNTVRLWETATGREDFAPLKHPFPVKYAEFNSKGSRLVTCCSTLDFDKCSAQIWDAVLGRPVGDPLKHGDGVLFASFSPDGSRVVTASEDFTANVWDAATGRQFFAPLQHGDQVMTAAFSPDGRWIVTASLDRTARIWNAETGDPLTLPLWHPVRLSRAAFLADGRGIVTMDQRGNHWLWRLPVDERPEEDIQKIGRLLSADTVTPAGGLAPRQSVPLPAVWQQLRASYPANFTASAQEIAAWHESEARASENEGNWRAVAFHLKQLLAVQPDDPDLLERLSRANSHLQKSN